MKVSGILYIFDLLVEKYNIITPKIRAKKLKELSAINNRLPSKKIENSINKWSKNSFL